jgi:hypothetical protein
MSAPHTIQIDPQGTKNLVDAICIQAANDYIRSKGKNQDAKAFFESRWFGAITEGADGEMFLEKLDAVIKKKKKQKPRIYKLRAKGEV